MGWDPARRIVNLQDESISYDLWTNFENRPSQDSRDFGGIGALVIYCLDTHANPCTPTFALLRLLGSSILSWTHSTVDKPAHRTERTGQSSGIELEVPKIPMSRNLEDICWIIVGGPTVLLLCLGTDSKFCAFSRSFQSISYCKNCLFRKIEFLRPVRGL